MAVVSYQSWYVGDNFPDWDIPLNTDLGPDDLVASNINQSSFWLVFRNSQGTDTRGNGAVTVKKASPAEITYRPDPTDVAATFNGSIFVKALTSETPARTVVWDPIPFQISAS